MTRARGSLRGWTWAAGLALLGSAAVPVAAFVAGKRVVGAYEGKYGLRDYLDSIFGGAARGEPAAWVLLLAPLGLVLVWAGVAWAWRRLPARPAGAAAAGTSRAAPGPTPRARPRQERREPRL